MATLRIQDGIVDVPTRFADEMLRERLILCNMLRADCPAAIEVRSGIDDERSIVMQKLYGACILVFVAAMGFPYPRLSFAQQQVVVGDTERVGTIPLNYMDCVPQSLEYIDFKTNSPTQWISSESMVAFAPTLVGTYTASFASLTIYYPKLDPEGDIDCTNGYQSFSLTMSGISDSLSRLLPTHWTVDMWPNHQSQKWEGTSTPVFDNNIAAPSVLNSIVLSGNIPPAVTTRVSVHGVVQSSYTANPFERRTPITLAFSYPWTPTTTTTTFDGYLNFGIQSPGKDSLFAYPLEFIFHPLPAPEAVDQSGNKTAGLLSYPNPFSSSIHIDFHLDGLSHVTLQVLNSVGVEAATLMKGEFPSGDYSKTFAGLDLPDGLYVLRLSANGTTTSKRIILLRH